MPTNLLLSNTQFEGIPDILVSENGLRSPRMLTVDLDYFETGGDDIIIPPGTILTKLPSGLGRALPNAVATATTATTAKVITVDNPYLFHVGDVITKANGDALGTVASIAPTAKTITLAANTTTAIAVNDVIIADAASAGTPYGMTISNINLSQVSNDVACYTSASVYRARVPYWSTALQTAFPEITMVGPSA